MKLWEKGKPLPKQIEAFTVGEDFQLDQKLLPYDCRASIAHAGMLEKIGLITPGEREALVKELQRIIALAEAGQFEIRPDQEDCHTAIENHLTERLGEAGKKIHTARSRNDQVLTALRLFYRAELQACQKELQALLTAMRRYVKRYGEVEFPGYTHTRKAMPASMGLWGGAFRDSLQDDRLLLKVARKLIDQSPLGSGAGYGVPLEIDREYTAKQLGFSKIQQNALYVQNSRGKFESTILHALAQIMLDLNRLAADLILFSMPEFGYFVLPEEFCTGSSIMPQKKNPDLLELVRSYYHTVMAHEQEVKSRMGNLISGYHRDVQLSKKPVMSAFAIARDSLAVMTLVFQHLRPDENRCRQALTEELYATAEVYRLVEQGVPFREAYRQIAKKYRSS